MKNKLLVSIITPTYNIEKYIGKCIESVLTQSYPYWKQIIVDDGSSDQTPEIIKKYLGDKRIYYLRLPHRGIEKLGETYNKALSLAKGDFVAVLEGDDFWPPDKLEKQIKLFSNPKVVLGWGVGKIVNEENKVLGVFPKAWEKWPEDVICNRPIGNALKVLLFHTYTAPAVTIMLRRQPLLEIGGFWQPQGICYVDHSTWLKMSLRGEFAYSRELMGYWRTYPTQITSSTAHQFPSTASELFWNTLTEPERKKFGILGMEKALQAWWWWIRGRRAMACGKTKEARQFFTKVILKSRGTLFLKAILALIASFVIPSLIQSKFATPLSVSLWLRKKILKL